MSVGAGPAQSWCKQGLCLRTTVANVDCVQIPPISSKQGSESDNLIRVRRISATEAARGFADLLDEVEATGESVVIERRGKAVATIGPAPVANGARVLEVLSDAEPDPDWLEELWELRRTVGPPQDRWSE